MGNPQNPLHGLPHKLQHTTYLSTKNQFWGICYNKLQKGIEMVKIPQEESA